ncbi:hypothetical protein JTE90_029426, partial [Oedothorax gibbosus]
ACGSEICRNGAQCKDGKCECPTGLSGTDCGTVEGCTEDLEKTCKIISSKCIYDSKKEKKASCECTKDNQKFDGKNCKDCSCGENEVCFFYEKKEKQCPCIDKFSNIMEHVNYATAVNLEHVLLFKATKNVIAIISTKTKKEFAMYAIVVNMEFVVLIMARKFVLAKPSLQIKMELAWIVSVESK